jgi:hypothetical protein
LLPPKGFIGLFVGGVENWKCQMVSMKWLFIGEEEKQNKVWG